jgi:hypothetical protein
VKAISRLELFGNAFDERDEGFTTIPGIGYDDPNAGKALGATKKARARKERKAKALVLKNVPIERPDQ